MHLSETWMLETYLWGQSISNALGAQILGGITYKVNEITKPWPIMMLVIGRAMQIGIIEWVEDAYFCSS